MSRARGINELGHDVFLLTLMAKGLLGAAQLAAAVAIAFGVSGRLPAVAHWLVKAELAEDPTDFFASRIIALSERLPGADTTFYALYFAAHGLLHLGVVAALLRAKVWAYPVAIAVLGGFIAYQLVEWLAGGGAMLLILSAVDVLVIVLTMREWTRRRTRQ